MFQKLSLLLFIFFSCIVNAQEALVLDHATKESLPGIAVFNAEGTIMLMTDLDGKVNIDQFGNDEVIYFKSNRYYQNSFRKSILIQRGNIVYLDAIIEGLQEVVVSASKFQQDKSDVPQKISSINQSSIKFANPQTSADLLEGSGSVYVQKSQLGGGSPMIRGFSTNRLLMTVDGVRMNNAIFRGGNIQNVISIDPFSIEQTEVVLGAGSVVYGSDAIGGVMSFYSLKPRISNSDSLLIDSHAALRYATANREKTGNFYIGFGLKKWAFATNITFSDFDDMKMGKHGPKEYLRPEYVLRENGEDIIVPNSDPRVQKPTGYDQTNLMQKIRYVPKENVFFDLGLFYTTTSDYSRYDRLIRYRGEQLRSAEWYYGPQRWFMANLQMTKLSSSSSFFDKLQTTLAYQYFQESRYDRDFGSELMNERMEAVDAFSFNIDFDKSLTPRTELNYGMEYVYNKIHSDGAIINISDNRYENTVSRYPDGSSWQSAAVYGTLKYKPSSHFVFQTGARYNYISLKSDFSYNNQFLNLPFDEASVDAGALTGSAGINWLPVDLLSFRLNFSTAFRAPNIDDIGKVFDSEPGSVVVPNKDLKPEYAYGADFGMMLNLNKLTFDGSLFYTYLDNALVRRDYSLNGQNQIEYDGELSDVQAVQNSAYAKVYGVELGLQYQFNEDLKLRSQYNIINGHENDEGEEVPVRHAAPDFGNTHLIWKKEKLTLDAFAIYNAKLTNSEMTPSELSKDYIYAKDQNGDPYAPSWLTLNLRSEYQLSDSATVNVSLENITNQRYKTYSSGIASAGRNLVMSLRYVF
ncbi:TonB-dependent receptor plug domain-containing protein [Aegicerativicinus sediminis]|uniref:TonB-dependent receptor plug domain-containing protein n=1 Tax=Aegicerativicinus sediminis TaxID=2893202 RepID=UPI001E5FDDE1|nr:TonB-dependent receptor [Aegicerativicinus sediminis]